MPATSSPSRREQRRAQHHAISRNQLLDAAEEVFGRKGFHETTLKEVAELAEFSVGSVYSFFENKDDLFRQIFLRRGEEYMPRMVEVLSRDAPALDVLHDLVEFEVQFFRDHPRFGRLYLRHSSATLQSIERLADQLMIDNFEESMRLQAGLISRGQAEGTICDGDPAVLARLLSGIVSAFHALDPWVMADEPSPREPMSLDELQALVRRTFAPSG